MAVVRVLPDKPFWETCLSKASKFFRLAVLPELVTRKSEQKPENVNPEQGATTADFCSDLHVTGSRKTANLKKCDASTSRKRDLSLSPLKQSNHDRDLFCFCRKPEFGQMIACDSDECKYMWFHFECVNVSKKGVPKGKWFCPACAHAKQKKTQNINSIDLKSKLCDSLTYLSKSQRKRTRRLCQLPNVYALFRLIC
jgi:hypothetical protein